MSHWNSVLNYVVRDKTCFLYYLLSVFFLEVFLAFEVVSPAVVRSQTKVPGHKFRSVKWEICYCRGGYVCITILALIRDCQVGVNSAYLGHSHRNTQWCLLAANLGWSQKIALYIESGSQPSLKRHFFLLVRCVHSFANTTTADCHIPVL